MLRSSRLGRKLLWFAVAVTIAFGFEIMGALETSIADASTSLGKFTLSGAIHGTYRLTKSKYSPPLPPGLDCQAGIPGTGTQAGGVQLYGIERYGDFFPLVDILQERHGAPTRSIDLAKTKNYYVSLETSSHNMWESGWVPLYRHGKVVYQKNGSLVFTHKGSGTLSMSRNGKSGSMSTDMVPYPGNHNTGKVHVNASWHCP